MTVLGTTDAPLDLFGGLVTDMAPCGFAAGRVAGLRRRRLYRGRGENAAGPAVDLCADRGQSHHQLSEDLHPAQSGADAAGARLGGHAVGRGVAGKRCRRSPRALSPNTRAKSATLFGREYIAISDGKFGVDIPRQYDGTNFDRVSQVGPGAGPAFGGDAAAEPALAIAAAPTGAVRANAVATITTTSAHGYSAGQTVTIAGVTDASFDGVFVIAAVPSPSRFTYSAKRRRGASGGGTATLTPQISAGVHQVAVFFKTRQGYLTQPSPPVSWTAAGGRRVTISGIPLALGRPERGRARSGFHGVGRRFVLLHHGPGQHAQHGDCRQHHHQRDARFLRHGAARGLARRFAVSAWWSWASAPA